MMKRFATNENPHLSPGQRGATYGLLTALALVAGYLELLIPLPVNVPGIKLGLGNAVVLFALVRMGARPAFYVMLAKVVCSMLLFSTPQMMAFSLGGGMLSWAVMAFAWRFWPFSEVGVSVLGGVAHNAGQLLVVALLLSPHTALINRAGARRCGRCVRRDDRTHLARRTDRAAQEGPHA